MKKVNPSKWIENKQFVAGLSMLIALIAWGIVAFTISPQKTSEIKNIPVRLSYNASVYQSLGLDVVNEKEYTVSITVTGPRSVVGGLTANDFIVYPQLSQVKEAGRYDLPLVVAKANTLAEFEIISITPGQVNVRFDRVVTKKFVVETDFSGIRIADGYILDKGYATPSEVTLIGPEQEMSQISKVVASVTLTNELTSTSIMQADLVLLDKDGVTLSKSYITFDNDKVEVTVPVLKKAELPLAVEFINVPDGFSTDLLQYTLSTQSLQVAGPASTIENMNKLVVGYIDLATFALDKEYTFDVELPTGFINPDNIATVTATLNREGLAKKTISVTDIQVLNEPANYKISIKTARINSVILIGKQQDLTALSSGSVIAVLDAADITVQKGEQTVPVRILVPSTNTVFATGSHTVLVDITTR